MNQSYAAHPHVHHNVHQARMHPVHPTPIKMNIAQQLVPPPSQHCIPNNYGAAQQYISPQIRVPQVKQIQQQQKNRLNNNQSGLLISNVSQKPVLAQQELHDQQQHHQQKHQPQRPQQQQSHQQHNDQQQKHVRNLTSQLQYRVHQKQPKASVQSCTNYNPAPSADVITSQCQVPIMQQTQTQQTVKIVTKQIHSIQTVDNQTKLHTQQQSNTGSSNLKENVSELICGVLKQTSTEYETNVAKEKTPMCLVNELARYNKIQHQYRLTGEQGPAHSKRFTVTLRLGEEEYTSDGPSIKKAQHSAASEAIKKTKYEHPAAKTNRNKCGKPGSGNITPTVELNALAMKLGEPTVYVLESQPNGGKIVLPAMGGANSINQHQNLGATSSSQQHQNHFSLQVHNHNYYTDGGQYGTYNRNGHNNIYSPHRALGNGRGTMPKICSKIKPTKHNLYNSIHQSVSKDQCHITLLVGSRKFVGVGETLQAARHDAAARALEVLKPLAVVEKTPEQVNNNISIDDVNSDLKSPISLVHEIALKRNLSVTFEVQSERGPPHMKTFITLCKVGHIVTEGEGNGKKISKKRAAEKMLEELKALPLMSPIPNLANLNKTKNVKRKPQQIKKKTRNLIKDKAEPEYPEEINPISKLIQIQQSVKEREPVYTVIEERGAPRRREFMMEVNASGQTARGSGPNKKIAKRNAAENILILMGYATATSSTSKESISKNANISESNEKSRKVTFLEHTETLLAATVPSSTCQGGSSGRQIVPGLLLMQQGSAQAFKSQTQHETPAILKENPVPAALPTEPSKMNVVTSNTVEIVSPAPGSICNDGVRLKDQLMYLAQLLGFQVQFSDYPKGNHGEYLTIVTLSTDPPQLCHGAGCNTEASQDQAAMKALKMLSELGLDNVKPKKSAQLPPSQLEENKI